jgi:hypothetical protein
MALAELPVSWRHARECGIVDVIRTLTTRARVFQP